MVNHLTRMHHGHICVAGLLPDGTAHVRPVLARGQWGHEDLAARGGLFGLGRVLSLGQAIRRPTPPHIEDHLVQRRQLRCHGSLTPPDFWALLESSCRDFAGVFGAELRPIGNRRWGTAEGQGKASLGCVRLARWAELYAEQKKGKTSLRIAFPTAGGMVNASLTDVRFFLDDLETPDEAKVRAAQPHLQSGGRAILSLGLTRSYQSEADRAPMHWLQVNGIHFGPAADFWTPEGAPP